MDTPNQTAPEAASQRPVAVSNKTPSIPAPRQDPYKSLLSTMSLSDWGTLALGVLGLIGTFIFGAWAIKSYDAQEAGNFISNQSLNAALDQHQLQALKLNNELLLRLLCSLGNNVRSARLLSLLVVYPNQLELGR